MAKFVIKDSGLPHEKFASGMERDTPEGKTDYTLVLDGPMFERWAEHLTTGAKKYAARNWMQANSIKELERFRESALRHFIQWFRGDGDEDHAAAVFFNINGAEYVKQRLDDPEFGERMHHLEFYSQDTLKEFLQWAEDHGITNV